MRHFTVQNILYVGIVIVAAVLLGVTGCSDSNDPEGGFGTLRMQLVDAPQCIEGLEHLYLVLDDVRVHGSAEGTDGDGGWISILPDTLGTDERTVDLLALVDGVKVILGEEDLPSGFYSQIRLVLQDSWIVVNGDSLDLKVPSGEQSGLKLIHGFTIDPGELTELTLDWDACRSLHESPPSSGIWKLKPTIRIIETVFSGSISGTVLPLDIGAAVMGVSSDLADTAITQVDPLDGGYLLQALPAGSWNLTAFAAGYLDSTRTGIIVQAGLETGDIDFGLEMAP